MLKQLYTQANFLSLTNEDIVMIQEHLDLNLEDEEDIYKYLYDNMNTLEQNPEVDEIISKKLLAGQCTVKWFKYEYNDEFSKEVLKEKLESVDIGFNANINQRGQQDNIDNIVSIIKEGTQYIIKIFIQDGYKRINNGLESRKELFIRDVVVNINIDECWVEIRAKNNQCKRIEQILSEKVGLKELKEVELLSNYHNDVNEFKNSLYNGFYLHYKAMPSEVIELTQDDGIAMVKIINSIDEYFNDNDGNKLLERLQTISLDIEGLSLVSILLAGIDNMGVKLRNDSIVDMSEQSLYTVLKDHLIEDSSYIRFSIEPNGALYTMQLGLNTKNIVFRTSVTEEVISYIRDKVL